MFNFKVNGDLGKEDQTTNRSSNSRRPVNSTSDKNFKTILNDKEKDSDEDGDPKKALSALETNVEFEKIAMAEEKKPKQPPSLFDLSKSSIKQKSEEETADVAQMASSDEMAADSPSAVFKNQALKEKARAKNNSEGRLENTDLKGKEEVAVNEQKTPTRFPQETVDLSYVNPLALNTTAISQTGSDNLQKMGASQKITLQQLVEALVKEISTIESQGKTDTVVTLKQPPLFAGANVVLTSFETAKGEFNIRFENLSQGAKAFMDMQQNQQSLLSSLEEKGYAVHILVATTQIETPKFTETAPQQSRDQSQQEQQQQQRRPRQNQEEER